MGLKERVDAELSNTDFYKRFFQDLEKKAQICPFHDDKGPSLSLNLEKGVYYCHACKAGGDKYEFWKRTHDVDFTTAVKAIAKEYQIVDGQQPQTSNDNELLQRVLKHHRAIGERKDILEVLASRGINRDTITKYRLGWQEREKRLWIPCFEGGDIAALRKYDLKHIYPGRKFTSIKGKNQTILFPLQVIRDFNTVWLMAGEPDCLTALSIGLAAVTFTNGEGKYNEAYLPYFKGKNVYICFDVDKAGQDAIPVIGSVLKPIAASVRVIELPRKGLPDNGDFTDYAKLVDFDKDTIERLMESAVAVRSLEDDFTPEVNAGLATLKVHETTLSKHFKKKIVTAGILAGKGNSTFFAPRLLEARCDMSMKDMCDTCTMKTYNGHMKKRLGTDGGILNLIEIDDKLKKREVQRLLPGVPPKCPQVLASEQDVASIDYIQLIPEVNLEIDDAFKFATVGAYAMNLQHLEDNELYNIEGRIINDPRTQRATLLADKAVAAEKSYKNFAPEKQTLEKIKETTPGRGADIGQIDKYFAVRINDLMTNVCGLKGRRDLVQMYDLIWHSVMTFEFQNRRVTKGWLEGLVLGDTRTGKSAAGENLIKHYGAGKYINCEGATLAGLIGGQNAYGNKLVFTWGAVPMQDGRLCVLDETQDLPTELIGSLSAIRSRGVASRPIVGGERLTKSRVRLIWLANPRSNRTLRQYSSGVDAIRELIGKEEDIARFDLALLISKDEVPDEEYFTDFEKVENIWDRETSGTLVNWAWSRSFTDIIIERQTEKAILANAKKIAQKFGASIPTVQPSEIRINLAKIATSMAILCYSTDNGEQVHVETSHAEYAMHFLNLLYTKKTFGAEAYAARTEARQSQAVDKEKVKTLLKPYGLEGISFLLRTNTFREKDFYYMVVDKADDPRGDADRLVKLLAFQYKCLYRKASYWIKETKFTDWLLELRDEFETGRVGGKTVEDQVYDSLFGKEK